MKNKFKIILIIALVLLLALTVIVSGYYINRIDKIKKEVKGLQKHGLVYDYYSYVGLDDKVDKKGFTDAYQISLIELIANPQNYHNKQVLIEGIGYFTDNSACVYLSTEDYKIKNKKNAVYISFDEEFIDMYKDTIKLCNGKAVMIVGTFDAMKNGPKSAYSGSLKKIKRYEESHVLDE